MLSKRGMWAVAGAVAVAACGVAVEGEEQQVEPVAQVESTLTAPVYSSLLDLSGTMEGSALIASNNPESVSREGLLFGTTPLTPTNTSTVRRTLSNTNLDPTCPAGSLRQFVFYMHHLNQLGAGARYYVFLEPATAGAAVGFNAYGAAITQMDTGTSTGSADSLDPGKSPSYNVSLALLTGALPTGVRTTNGSRFINLGAGTFSQAMGSRFTLVNLAAAQGNSVDARVRVNANGCVRLRVVAASATNASEALADTLGKSAFAWGNVPTTTATPGGAPCTDVNSIGWGRPAGVYKFERWAGSTSVSLTSATSLRGWRLLAAPVNREQTDGQCVPATGDVSPSSNAQRAPAIGYYNTNTSGQTEGRDSDAYSTANYGAEYVLNYGVTNSTGQCVVATLHLSSYPGTNTCASVPLASSKTRHYDGAAQVTEGTTKLAPVRLFTKCPDGTKIAPIVSKQLTAGQSVNWSVKFFVPGLISIPQGVLLSSCPCGQTC
jgi:hypothetical protein